MYKICQIVSAGLGLFATAFALFWCASCAAQQEQPPPPTVGLEKDVIFGYAGNEPLKMDVVRPLYNSSLLPVVLCIHGGGWAAGDKRDMHTLAYGVASLGYEAVCINYRLAPNFKYPSQVQDLTAAMDYIRAHAKEMKVDPNKIAALGQSAGGHLALLLAETSENRELGSNSKPSVLKGACSIAGPTDLTAEYLPDAAKNALKGFFGFPKETNLETYKKASPIFCLTKKCPPLLLIHGDQDALVPYTQATSMLKSCSNKNVPAELVTLHNAGHGGGDAKEWQAALVKIAQFLDRTLRQDASN